MIKHCCVQLFDGKLFSPVFSGTAILAFFLSFLSNKSSFLPHDLGIRRPPLIIANQTNLKHI